MYLLSALKSRIYLFAGGEFTVSEFTGIPSMAELLLRNMGSTVVDYGFRSSMVIVARKFRLAQWCPIGFDYKAAGVGPAIITRYFTGYFDFDNFGC